MYKSEPSIYKELLGKGQYDKTFSEDIDPYYLRDPLFRIIGDWDPSQIEVLKEKKTSGPVTVEQQSINGLRLEDRYVEGHIEDSSPVLSEIVDALPFAKTRSLLHIQKPGQMHMLHMDANYGNGFWDYLGVDKHSKLARLMIMLDDWAPGQVMMFGGKHIHHWKKGDAIYFRWQDIPHGTANFGHTDRPLLIVTGEITKEFENLLSQETITEIKI
jgi:hypothetical protein